MKNIVMKNIVMILLLSGLLIGFLTSCSGVGVRSGGVYRHHYGPGGWWGFPRYINRRPIIVTPPIPGDRDDAVNLPVHPEPEAPAPEAMPLPAEPMMDMDMDMDMGMPDLMD